MLARNQKSTHAPMPSFAPLRSFPLQRKCACGGAPGPAGECEACRKKRLQRKPAHSIEPTEVPPIVHEVLRSPGEPLDRATRGFMEPRFGHDFSRVRVHTDAKAAESTRGVHALAYTVGADVVFGAGQFRPETGAGQRLLAHELGHVLQQSAAGAALGKRHILPMGNPHDALEYEAEGLANAVLSRQEADEHLEIRTQAGPVDNPMLRKKDGPEGGGEEGQGKEPPEAAGGEKVGGGSAPVATPPCDPQGLSRPEYLKQTGTSTKDFGLTTLSGTAEVPTVATSAAAKGKKGVTLNPTDAKLPPLTSVYTKADVFIEGESISDPGECPGGKYPLKLFIDSSGAKKIREAELEHCADFKYAFDISLRRYADVVNNLSKKDTVFTSQKAAENYVAKIVGPAPDTWGRVFKCLLEKSKKARDGTEAKPGWHTPHLLLGRPPRLKDNCDFARAVISEGSLQQVGKFKSQDIIKDCGEGPPAKAKAAAKPAGGKSASVPVQGVRGQVGKELTVAHGPENSMPFSVGDANHTIVQRQSVPGLTGPSPKPAPTRRHLTLGAPHDEFEQEAERMAQRVMSQSVTSATTRFDLSGVRIHTDGKAAESARAMNALAYTVGHDVVFGAGQYQPTTSAGRSLLAHELTHVVQEQTNATRAQHIMKKDPQDTPPKAPAPAPDAKVNECEPARALTWGDFSDKVPKDATAEANTGTRIKLIQANGSDMFQCTLDSANVWAMPQAKNAADNAKNGCQEKIQACEDWISNNPGKTGHNDPPAQRKCPASVIPKRVEFKTKKECTTIYGEECKKAQVADAALLLKHEQLHFTISCILVNKANQALKAGKNFDAITNSLDAKWRKLNADYDTETKNRCDQTKQDEWQKKVDKRLPSETIP